METNQLRNTKLEEEIREALTFPDEGNGFLKNLRSQVLAAHSAKRPGRRFPQVRPVWLGGFILGAIVLAILIIGPQKVYADLQFYLGYVTGAGFVNTENGLALKEPVSQNQDGRIVQVEQLVATEKETVLVLRLTGYAGVQNANLGRMTLNLADGTILLPGDQEMEHTSTPGEYVGVYKFNPLPDGAKNVTFSWQQVLGYDPSAGSQDWEIKLNLYPISDPEVASSLPASYEISHNSIQQQGITFTIDQVSASPSGLAVQTRTIFPQPFIAVWPDSVFLKDDQGKEYPQNNMIHLSDQGQQNAAGITGEDTPGVKGLQWTFDFPGVPLDASQLTLQVEQMKFMAINETHFLLDVGKNPKVGDVWPIAETIWIGETPVVIEQVRLMELGTSGKPRVGLALDIKPVHPNSVKLTQVEIAIAGSSELSSFDVTTGVLTQPWPQGKIPSGPIFIQITVVSGTLQGQWQLQWEPQHP